MRKYLLNYSQYKFNCPPPSPDLIAKMEQRGLDSTDIAKIGGMLLGVKYTLWIMFIAGGVRFRPIVGLVQKQHTQELLRKKANTAAQRLGMKNTPEYWMQRK
jgi:hypothetical protein